MTITIFSNCLNHHQAPIADELYSILGTSFSFVETKMPTPTSNKGSSEDFSSRPYLIEAWKDDKLKNMALLLALKSDVAVFGDSSLLYEVERSRKTNKISFDLSERWLKRGVANLLSPRLLKHQWYYHTLFYKKPVYKLCASAYAAKDQYKMLSFRNKCYKWGYFPKLDNVEVETQYRGASISIIWCARLLKLKHPDIAVRLAERLKKRGYVFSLDMYGDGPELKTIKKLVKRLDVEDVVHLRGARPNEEILNAMRSHHIFIFTSDKNEGWGVVANEAMANGCALIADSAIGSTPYLIKHRETGCSYISGNLDCLENEVVWLMDNQLELQRIRKNGQEYIKMLWNPHNAARSLITLSNNLLNGQENTITDGPCSPA